ncbi:MAG: glycerophosphodiester phosphodiesterase [Pseudonocardiaceae bacterium]|nr:glycerophosphodiester phosphodiesterase [Pseudonocardiaceae bacterium]
MVRRRIAALAISGIAAIGVVGPAGASAEPAPAPADPMASKSDGPTIYGHRGASGYRPEHTLVSYALAARMGADYIETDLVPTKDGELVARHENEISGTTDVEEHPEFADRKTTKTVDGEEVTGWFTEDFTLAELKTLRAKERLPELRPHNTLYDGRYEIPTLQEILELREGLSRDLNREIGIAPETKHPTYFRNLKRPIEPGLVRALNENGLNKEDSKVLVQSFEVGNLRGLDDWLNVDLVQLTLADGAPYDFVESGDPRTYADLVTPKGLREVAGYADVLGPEKDQVIPRDDKGFLTEPTSLVDDAHAAGLTVVPFTFRNENEFLPGDYVSSDDPAAYGDAFAEYQRFFATGIDGIFSDNPDTAVEARAETR